MTPQETLQHDHQTLKRDLVDLADLVERLPVALRRLESSEPGYRSDCGAGGGGGGTGERSSHPEALAAVVGHDDSLKTLREVLGLAATIHQATVSLHHATGKLERELRRWAPRCSVVADCRKLLPCPNHPAVMAVDEVPVLEVQWCKSCQRDGGYCTPVAVRPDGTHRYADRCTWCGEWRAANDGQDPPLAILEARHRGERLTPRRVAELTAPSTRHERPTSKRKRKAKR